MIEIGKKQVLKVLRRKEMGVYLGDGTPGEQGVLLPKRQVPEGTKDGDEICVFVYKDSEDRPVATVRDPLLTLGQTGILTVVQTGRIGAFLDWGLERDLFLPFREQRWKVHTGEQVFVAVYLDRSGRLCATMKTDRFLRSDPPYKKDDFVTGTLYEINREIGGFVAVDNTYFGLIPAGELPTGLVPAVSVEARVSRRHSDGKLVLSVRKKAYKQMNTDAQAVYELMEKYQGVLPFTDKSDPDLIRLETGLSKNAFKRAVGHLLKEGKIIINQDTIEIRR